MSEATEPLVLNEKNLSDAMAQLINDCELQVSLETIESVRAERNAAYEQLETMRLALGAARTRNAILEAHIEKIKRLVNKEVK